MWYENYENETWQIIYILLERIQFEIQGKSEWIETLAWNHLYSFYCGSVAHKTVCFCNSTYIILLPGITLIIHFFSFFFSVSYLSFKILFRSRILSDLFLALTNDMHFSLIWTIHMLHSSFFVHVYLFMCYHMQ